MAGLRRGDLVRVAARSLLLQASWSFEGMQGLGFAFAMEPALKRLYGEGEALAAARGRHLGHFNTHPFLACALLGCAVRLEEEGGAEVESRLEYLKSSLMGPFGGMGDAFFWGGLRTALAVAATALTLLGWRWGPLVLVIGFLGCGLAARAYCFAQGYRRGFGVVEAVCRLRPTQWSDRLKAASALLLGGVLAVQGVGTALVPGWQPWFSAAVPGWVVAGAGWVLVLGLGRVMSGGVRPVWLIFLAAGLSAVVLGR